MSNILGQDTLVINHAQLRAPSHLQGLSQQQLLALETVPQANGEYLFLRKVSVKSTANQLIGNLQNTLLQQSNEAVDGDSILAENAPAVRFYSLGQLMARLSQDIQARRQNIWFWQSWQQLFTLPVADALAQLWAENITDLADMVKTMEQRGELAQFWLSISMIEAGFIVKSIKQALGVPKLSIVQGSSESYKTKWQIPTQVIQSWQAITTQLDKDDQRIKLAAIIILLQWRADFLFDAQVEASICRVVDQLVSNDQTDNNIADLELLNHPQNRKHRNSVNKQDEYSDVLNTQEKTNNKTISEYHLSSRAVVDVTENEQEKIDGKQLRFNPPSFLNEEQKIEGGNKQIAIEGEAESYHKKQDIKQNAEKRSIINTDSSTVPQTTQIDSATQIYPGQGAIYCQQGGLFYLLNFMARKNIQVLLRKNNAYQTLQGAWGCLYRFAGLLQLQNEPALEQFIAYKMGLDNVTELKKIAILEQPELYQQNAESFYGLQVWNPQLLRIPAQIEYTASHLDIHYPIQQVHIEVRKAGLDINPGWLPWLGMVVNFHYHEGFVMNGEQA